MQGWVSIDRAIIESRLFSRSGNHVKICLYLILSANHNPGFYRGIELERGQCVRSLTQIADSCGMTRKAVRCAIDNAVRDGFIEIDEPFGAQKGHRITVCNYDTYQSQNNNRAQNDSGRAQSSPTNNNDNTVDNDNTQQDKAPSVPSVSNGEKALNQSKAKITNAYTQSFEEWWALYRKGSKANAFKRWKQVRPPENIIELTENYLCYIKEVERPQKDGEGWLNGRFFETEWTHEAQGTKLSASQSATTRDTFEWS